MPSAPAIPIVLFGAGLLITWGCSGPAEAEDPPVAQIQTVVLNYDHGAYKEGDSIDVACLTDGRQGDHVTGEGCDCLHLHSDGPGISFTNNPGPYADTDMGGCGHGCMRVIAEDDVTVLCGGRDVSDPLHPRRGLCVESPCGE